MAVDVNIACVRVFSIIVVFIKTVSMEITCVWRISTKTINANIAKIVDFARH